MFHDICELSAQPRGWNQRKKTVIKSSISTFVVVNFTQFFYHYKESYEKNFES